MSMFRKIDKNSEPKARGSQQEEKPQGNRSVSDMSVGELEKTVQMLMGEIEDRKKSQISEARARIREIADEYGLEVTIRKKTDRKPTKKAEPKYRNPATGETWSGRGKSPKWLTEALKQGKTKEDFLI